tara:strand:+ start:419 stop:817 length:399 start_codon:yes stop_codon:yes gene_type:complete
MNRTDINKRNLNKILLWCKETYGVSRFKNINYLTVEIDNTIEDAKGQYCPYSNRIYINPKHHTSFIEVIDTMIHEYTHFKQDIKVMYFKYMNEYSYNYSNHPYEHTANKVAERDRRKCFHELFHKKYKLDIY